MLQGRLRDKLSNEELVGEIVGLVERRAEELENAERLPA